MTRSVAMATAFAVAVMGAAPAWAIPVNFCFRGYGVYSDNHDDRVPLANGQREPYFANDNDKPLRGVRALVMRGSNILFSDFTGDGLFGTQPGCRVVEIGSLPASLNVSVFTRARSNTHTFRMVLPSGDSISSLTVSLNVTQSPPNGTITITWLPTDNETRMKIAAMNVFALGAFRHAGSVTSGNFQVRVNHPQGNQAKGPNGGPYDNEIWLNHLGPFRKFTVGHELGHAIGRLSTHGKTSAGNDYTLAEDALCPHAAGHAGTHTMGSKEWAGAALSEGFAHFVSADTFNDHNTEHCVFNYYKNEFGLGNPVVDCNADSTDFSVNGSFPRRYMITKPCSPLYGGRGVELDWLRMYWSMHTRPSQFSFNSMTSWMDQAWWWSRSNAYSRLDDSANWIGGTLLTRWNYAKARHGVNAQ
jgi:hypothetical protein